MSPRVVVVGAGIAGLACAHVLVAAGRPGVEVEVRERGRVVGGRLASRWIDGRIVDSGAAYFTATSPEFAAVVDDWTLRGVVRAWTNRFPVLTADGGLAAARPGPLRYAAPRGLRSLAADLVSRGGIPIRQQTPVRAVGPGPTVDGERVAAVVLAMPDPQALRLLDRELAVERAAVADRPWTPALTVIAGWPHRAWPPLDGAFVHGDPTLEWVADDGRRRGDGAPVLVAHSTAAFAASRLAEPAEAAPAMLESLHELLGIDDKPSWSRVQRWSYARPTTQHSAPFLLTDGGIGFAGDSWGEQSKVETAWRAGTALGHALLARLT